MPSDLNSVVFVIDDDASVRDAVRTLLKSVGLDARVFGSTEEFLNLKRPEVPSCLVLDIRLPGVTGLEFQDELKRAGIRIPIIFITAHGDIPMALRAMKAGAVEFLTKPFQKQDLLAAIHQALDRDRARREEQAEVSALQSRFQRLTPREREVLDLVVTGLLNKQIAAKLGLSEVTVKAHRGQAMQKMQADSLAGLVRMTERLKTQPLQ
jgi:RNA polymerase sigma factor (sigma-70 family)